MNTKVCEKCSNTFDSNLNTCPHCNYSNENLEYNIRNPFLEIRNEMINNGNTNNLAIENNNSFVNNDIMPDVLVQKTDETPVIENDFSTSNSFMDKESSFTLESDDTFIHTDINNNETTDEKENSLVINDNLIETETDNNEESNPSLEMLKSLHNPIVDFEPEVLEKQKQEIAKEKESQEKEATNKKHFLLLRDDFIILLFICMVVTIYLVITDFNPILLIHQVIILISLIIGYRLSVLNNIKAIYVGLLSAILFLLTIIEGNIVDALLGGFLLVHSIFFLTKLKK